MLEVLPNNLFSKIQNGENALVEFKSAQGMLPKSLFETICAMLNTGGGDIFLGLEDNGTICGVTKTSILKLRKDLANLCNNPQKIYPTVRLNFSEYIFEGRTILHLYVYESSDVHRSAGRIYIRTDDGDRDITDNTHLVSQVYIRKSSTYIENKIFPYASLDDLRPDLIKRARRLSTNRSPGHPWKDMSDLDLLKSSGLYERDLQTGAEGINLAGILLLGKDESIASVAPYYRTDALLRVENIDRYDDRDDVRTNLIDSCDRLTDFIIKHTSDKFYLDDDGQRLDIRSIIARELCANMLIHREYSNPVVAQLIISKDAIYASNASRPRFTGYLDVSSYSPFPKNPKIAKFFKEIGYADELGSGIKKIDKYTRIYSNARPIFREGDTFEVTVPLTKVGASTRPKISSLRIAILERINSGDGLSREEINRYAYPLMTDLDKTKRAAKVHNIIADLSRKKIIANKGSRNKPLWISTKYTTKYTTNTQPNTQPKKPSNQPNTKKRSGV